MQEEILKTCGVEDLLRKGPSNAAAGFAPTELDLTDEERKLIFEGVGDDAPPNIPSTPYKRIAESFKEGKLGEAFGNPIIKKSAYAAVGLIAASFIYQAKKDRGEQEIAGPPLLPGGSAYEAMPSRASQVPNTSMFSGYNPGTGYSVHLEGSREQIESFTNSAGSVARGPINSTMSRGLPQLGRDNFSEIAGSF